MQQILRDCHYAGPRMLRGLRAVGLLEGDSDPEEEDYYVDLDQCKLLFHQRVLSQFLLGKACYSFKEGYDSFTRLSGHFCAKDEADTKKNTRKKGTNTSDSEGTQGSLPAPSVQIVARKTTISDARRKAVKFIIAKLFKGGDMYVNNVLEGPGYIDQPIEPQEFWMEDSGIQDNLRSFGGGLNPSSEDYFLFQVEEDIFNNSDDDLEVYENLLLNQVFHRMRNWELLWICPVRNAAVQTDDSFLQEADFERIIRQNSPSFPEDDIQALLRKNLKSRRRARNISMLSLRHAYTQTCGGSKCLEVESSQRFNWLELAPQPIRFFPILDAETQTDEAEVLGTEEICRMVADSEPSSDVGVVPIVDQYLQHLETMISMDHPIMTEKKQTKMDVQSALKIAFFNRNRRQSPGSCASHPDSTPALGDCPDCSLAALKPAPWLSNLETAVGLLSGCRALYSVAFCRLRPDDEIPEDAVQLLCQELVWLHVVRKVTFELGKPTSGDREGTAAFRHTLRSCACLDANLQALFRVQHRQPTKKTQFLERLKALAVYESEQKHRSHRHRCLGCEKTERTARSFLVCVKCVAAKSFARAFYCGIACQIKDQHHHKFFHGAFSVAADNLFP